jgi:pimeloyl-ACP methyl ester carboxylesterase
MGAILLKYLLSISIGLMTLYVPQKTYQDALDSLPGIPERVKGMDLQGWSFSEKISKETGITHYYYECGPKEPNAPVLLCLHGFNTDGSVFFKLKSLSDKYHIIAYNFPERTSLYKGTIRDFSDILDDFCKSAQFDTVTVLGNSIGGGIALNFVANTSATIQKLILTSSTVFGATPENQRLVKGMANRLLGYPDYKLYYLLTKGAAIIDRIESPELTEEIPENGLVIKHVDWYKEILKSFYWYQGVKDVPMVRCPVIVINGKKDKLMNANEINATKAVFPKAEMHLFDDAAHSLVYSHAKKVDAILRSE